MTTSLKAVAGPFGPAYFAFCDLAYMLQQFLRHVNSFNRIRIGNTENKKAPKLGASWYGRIG